MTNENVMLDLEDACCAVCYICRHRRLAPDQVTLVKHERSPWQHVYADGRRENCEANRLRLLARDGCPEIWERWKRRGSGVAPATEELLDQPLGWAVGEPLTPEQFAWVKAVRSSSGPATEEAREERKMREGEARARTHPRDVA